MKLDNIYQEEKKSNFVKVSEIIITMASRPSGFIGLSILIFHVILAFISPYVAPYDFKPINPDGREAIVIIISETFAKLLFFSS